MIAQLEKLPVVLEKMLRPTWVLALLVVAVGLVAGGLIGRYFLQGPGELAYRLAPGQRWRHQLRFAGSGTMDMNSLTKGQNSGEGEEQVQTIQTIVEGDLVMSVLEKDERRIIVAYSLTKPAVVLTLNGQPLLDAAATMEADLAQPVFAEMDLQGRIESLRFAPESTDLSRHCLRSLLAATQLVLPAAGAATEAWESWEQAPMGRCRAVYQADSDSPWGTIGLVKTREEYEPPAGKNGGANGQIAATMHPDGALRIAFDLALGQIRSIQGSETLVIKVGGKALSTSESKIALEFLSKENVPTVEFDRLGRLGRERAQAVGPESLLAIPSWRRGHLLGQ
jgi:hypothetical protein